MFSWQPKQRFLPVFRLVLSVWLVLLSACDPAAPVVTPTFTPPVTGSPLPPPQVTISSATRTPSPTFTPFSPVGLKPESLRGAIIQFWHASSGPAGTVMQTLVDEFNTTNEWKMIVVPVKMSDLDGMDERLRSALQAGDPPEIATGYLYQALGWDALQPSEYPRPSEYSRLSEYSRYLVDLNTYVNDPLWGYTAAEQADFYPVFWDHDLADGRRLGVPAQRSAQLLFYNQGWARSLGYVDPPATPEAFQEQACAMARLYRQDADPDNDGAGGWIISTQYAAMYSWLAAFSSQSPLAPFALNSRQSEASTLAASTLANPYRFNTRETRQAFSFLRQLYDQGCAWLPETQYPEAEFAARQGLFAVGSLLDIPHQAQAFREAERTGGFAADAWTVLPFPSPSEHPTFMIYGPSYVLLSSSPERQLAAWVFVKWLLEPQQQARLVQATGAFPLRKSIRDELNSYAKQNPQWAAAAGLLHLAAPEPALQSWGTVRWALSDASTQLFRSYFTIDQVPTLTSYLDAMAVELHQSYIPPTPTGQAAFTATQVLTPTLSSGVSASTAIPSLTPIP